MKIANVSKDTTIQSFIEVLTRANKGLTLMPKIEKAISMFKRERNLLYIDSDPVAGTLRAVIKSQSHPEELEYAIFLNKTGNFYCTTQNLRPCGGLRGQICKHILLGLVALVKSGAMKGQELSGWVKETIANKPALNKDDATQIFLKYKNALTGEVDWRPVEIMPEDFMAL